MNDEVLRVEEVEAPGGRNFDDEVFPLVLVCRSPGAALPVLRKWIEANHTELLARSSRHGALLLRGFPVRTAEDFDACVDAFGLENFSYRDSLSNAVRVNCTERVFTANEAPSEATIRLHHEMAQTPIHPRRLFFFCEQPAQRGGATSLCRSDVLFQRLAVELPDFTHACETKGLRYTNVMPPEDDPLSALGRSWQGTLSVATRPQAEAKLADLGYTWEWLPDGCLRATTPVLPAVLAPSPGRKTFFNQLIATRSWKDRRNDPATAVCFGDGSPLPSGSRTRVSELAEETAVDAEWQHGDVALVDNRVVLHGRRSFEGTRRVLAAFTTDAKA